MASLWNMANSRRRFWNLPVHAALAGTISTECHTEEGQSANYARMPQVPEDFETEGFHWNYNFYFPYHPHHRTHRVHPAKWKIDGTKVLIKAQKTQTKDCSLCSMLGSPLLHEQESDHWVNIEHPNIQACFLKMTDAENGVVCYVLEFPVISLKDLTMRLAFSNTRIPEPLIWNVIQKLASAVEYLHSQNVNVELYEPQHFILDQNGNVKVENLLLYLPKSGRSTYRTGSFSQHNAIYIAPEQWLGQTDSHKTVIWALGCLFYELASLTPAFLLETHTIQSQSSSSTHGSRFNLKFGCTQAIGGQYSVALEQLISRCLQENIDDRPTFSELIDISRSQMDTQDGTYNGPRSLLDLLPDDSVDDDHPLPVP